jgi:hypothetical protein
MEAITFWCFVIIYLLAFVLVIFITLLAADCLKTARELDALYSSHENNGDTRYGERKGSHLGIDGIHTV